MLPHPTGVAIHVARTHEDLPDGLTTDAVAQFIHDKLIPYEDTVEDTRRAICFALDNAPNQGGFLITALAEGRLVGALLSLDINMHGFVADHFWVYITVDESCRGHGIGRTILEHGLRLCKGTIKGHIDFENEGSRKLFKSIGFVEKYIEVRRYP